MPSCQLTKVSICDGCNHPGSSVVMWAFKYACVTQAVTLHLIVRWLLRNMCQAIAWADFAVCSHRHMGHGTARPGRAHLMGPRSHLLATQLSYMACGVHKGRQDTHTPGTDHYSWPRGLSCSITSAWFCGCFLFIHICGTRISQSSWCVSACVYLMRPAAF